MFTTDNTADFTPAQLATLNQALTELVAREYDTRTAEDLLSNAWVADDSQNTVELLVKRATSL